MSNGPNQVSKLNANTLRAEARAIWRATYVAIEQGNGMQGTVYRCPVATANEAVVAFEARWKV